MFILNARKRSENNTYFLYYFPVFLIGCFFVLWNAWNRSTNLRKNTYSTPYINFFFESQKDQKENYSVFLKTSLIFSTFNIYNSAINQPLLQTQNLYSLLPQNQKLISHSKNLAHFRFETSAMKTRIAESLLGNVPRDPGDDQCGSLASRKASPPTKLAYVFVGAMVT